ncbi:fructose-6-phosphate aldolase [Clostridium sp. cel8]|uniref:fructose-6-phosphate aldolase n=1 Tax=Clostridium sp. cel8 TaxID=2663123 RepID=UPI0015F3DEF0|nr:fructose-6-phosphate aldolase [Clostridium sp. cel8]MBA5850097.1 fructose-6-phosphate aldolase [Clostridium sp. cel8]
MEFMFDTANIEVIRKYIDVFPITGITSNPSIIKKEGKIDFFNHFKEIRSIIGFDKSMHIQVVATDCEGIVKDAKTILDKIDDKVYVKIPVTEDGLKAMRILKSEGVGITATAVYTKAQALLALETGADFIAPYFNRMENSDMDPRSTIKMIADMIDRYGYKTKILAASFKNIGQVMDAFSAGAQTATVAPEILCGSVKMASIKEAVENFTSDWKSIFGKGISISDL